MADLGNGAVVEMALMGLTHGPGLELAGGITGGVEVVVAGDLGQSSTPEAVVTLMQIGPGGEVAGGAGLTGGIRGKNNGSHRTPPEGSGGVQALWARFRSGCYQEHESLPGPRQRTAPRLLSAHGAPQHPLEWKPSQTPALPAMPDQLTKLAYQTIQQGKGLFGLAHKEVSTRLMGLLAPGGAPKTVAVEPELLGRLRSSMDALTERDWQEAEQGIYPASLLFDAPWLDWAARYPLVWLDMPSTWARRNDRKVRDLPQDVEPEAYPDYYLQNFHHQTDGYLSDHSASLYDLQVEILFNGTADPMRRRVLAPLVRGLRAFQDRPAASIRVLDVATGTGRTLRQIRGALPKAQLVGLDLSSSYLRQANRWLSELPGELPQLVQGNGEDLPFADGSFQAVSCVFLLHELPGEARQNVLNEAFRVLEPGGVVVLADSVQLADSPQFSTAMENFRRVFHEPYYRDYISDDINTRLSMAGFEAITAESHFMSRVWAARKPGGSAP